MRRRQMHQCGKCCLPTSRRGRTPTWQDAARTSSAYPSRAMRMTRLAGQTLFLTINHVGNLQPGEISSLLLNFLFLSCRIAFGGCLRLSGLTLLLAKDGVIAISEML